MQKCNFPGWDKKIYIFNLILQDSDQSVFLNVSTLRSVSKYYMVGFLIFAHSVKMLCQWCKRKAKLHKYVQLHCRNFIRQHSLYLVNPGTRLTCVLFSCLLVWTCAPLNSKCSYCWFSVLSNMKLFFLICQTTKLSNTNKPNHRWCVVWFVWFDRQKRYIHLHIVSMPQSEDIVSPVAPVSATVAPVSVYESIFRSTLKDLGDASAQYCHQVLI